MIDVVYAPGKTLPILDRFHAAPSIGTTGELIPKALAGVDLQNEDNGLLARRTTQSSEMKLG